MEMCIIIFVVLFQTELSPKKIAIKYLKGGFIVDFISSIPFDYFTLFTTSTEDTGFSPSLLKASRAFRIVRLTKLLSLLRLLRISRVLRYLQRWEDVRMYMYVCVLLKMGGCTYVCTCTLEDVHT